MLHKCRVPSIWKGIRFTHYIYSSFYSIILKQPFAVRPFLLRSRKNPTPSLSLSFTSTTCPPWCRQTPCPRFPIWSLEERTVIALTQVLIHRFCRKPCKGTSALKDTFVPHSWGVRHYSQFTAQDNTTPLCPHSQPQTGPVLQMMNMTSTDGLMRRRFLRIQSTGW